MKVLLTGGSGDMGVLLAKQLKDQGDEVVILDLAEPHDSLANDVSFVKGSILDRDTVHSAMSGVDCVVHIAAWHGIHEHDGTKDAYDFHDVNVTGTFNVLQASADAEIKKFVFISSTSVDDTYGLYGHTKVLNEEMARTYALRHEMDIITLRPRAFIPPWNKAVYESFLDWANWFKKGAVHISDVCQATLKSINFLKASSPPEPAVILQIDGAYEYTQDDLEKWDDDTFRKIYGENAQRLCDKHNLDLTRKPKIIGSTKAENVIGYKATYSLKSVLKDLETYGDKGPAHPLHTKTHQSAMHCKTLKR